MEPNNKTNLEKTDTKIVETYAEDMARVIGNNREGLIKKIIDQEEERDVEKINSSPGAKKNKIFGIAGMFLIVATFTILIIATLTKQETGVVPIEKQFTPLIFNDRNVFVDITGKNKDQIISSFYNTISKTSLSQGQVEGIYLTENKNIIGLKRFLSLMGSSFVLPTEQDPTITLVSENFLTGVVQNENSKDVFILIKVRSIPDIFSSLREWENKMFLDMHDFFGTELSSTTKYLLLKNFSDNIVANKNARMLYEGEAIDTADIALMYVFANDNSIVITKSIPAAREIMSRLSSGKIEK